MKNLINYNDGEIEVAISIKENNIWLSQKQIAELFDKDVRTVNDHIKAIYKEAELLENSTIRKFRIVQKEGDREVARDISHYNLDMIISVGYRVNSKKATKFRQWATTILKEYITQGYAISKSLKLDYEKYKKQYENIELKETKEFHDRILIIDEKQVYHIGASLKDLAQKIFAFSKIDIDALNIMEKLR